MAVPVYLLYIKLIEMASQIREYPVSFCALRVSIWHSCSVGPLAANKFCPFTRNIISWVCSRQLEWHGSLSEKIMMTSWCAPWQRPARQWSWLLCYEIWSSTYACVCLKLKLGLHVSLSFSIGSSSVSISLSFFLKHGQFLLKHIWENSGT